MEEKLNAITLRAVDYGESDKILTLFSLEKGVVSATVKGVKKDKAKLKFVAEPFSFCELIVSEKAGRRSVTNASSHKSYFRLSQNLDAYFSACVIAEFITLFFKDAEEELFANLVLSLENLLKGVCYSTLVKFILLGLSYAGYGLDFSGCNKCGEQIENRVFLDVDSSCFLCENCALENSLEFKISTYTRLLEIDNASFDKLDNEKDNTKNCLRLLDNYVSHRLGFKLKSIQFIL